MKKQFTLDLNQEIIVDNFAGGGGASTGIYLGLGRHVDHALNHAWDALGMHRINHAQTVHHCEDVFEVDPATMTEGRKVGFGWFSPDCKHFSKAKGGKPLSKKIRGLAFVILRWAKIRTRVIHMENVEEIKTWGPLLLHHPEHPADCNCNKPCGKADPAHKGRTWRSFRQALGGGVAADNPDIPEILEVLGTSVTREELMRGFGYESETRELRACDYGAPTIRKRLFMIARCDGRPIVWPAPTHGAPGKLTSPSGQKLKPWRTIAECIDWHVPCHSIFLNKDQAKKARCRRPLAGSTLRRIATGIDRYVLKAKKPFLVSLTHQGGERVESVDEPGKTITGAHRGEKAVVVPEMVGEGEKVGKWESEQVAPETSPFLMQSGHTRSNSEMVKGADEPMRTQATQSEHALVAPVLSKFHGDRKQDGKHDGAERNHPVSDPIKTQDTSNRFGLVEATVAPFLTEHANASNQRNCPADKPMPTQCAEVKGGHFAMVAPVLAHTAHGETDKNGKKRGKGAHPVTEPGQSTLASPDLALISANLMINTTDHTGGPADKPCPTIVASGHHHLVTGVLVGAGGPTYSGKPRSVDQPGGTQTTESHTNLAAAHMVKLRGDNVGHAADEPGHTASAGGQHHGVVAASLVREFGASVGQAVDGPAPTVMPGGQGKTVLSAAYLAQHNAGFNTTPGHEATEPLSSITQTGSQQNVVAASIAAYYGNDAEGQAVTEPGRTVTTKERFGLVESQLAMMTPDQIEGARRVAAFLRLYGVVFEGEFATVQGYVIVDIGMRMLLPRELFRAQGFPEDYVIDRAWVIDPKTGALTEVRLNKEQQIRMCGNSVCPPVAAALVAANVPELAVPGWFDRKKRRVLTRINTNSERIKAGTESLCLLPNS